MSTEALKFIDTLPDGNAYGEVPRHARRTLIGIAIAHQEGSSPEGEHGAAWLSNQTLANRVGINEKTVRRHKKLLAKLGIITIKKGIKKTDLIHIVGFSTVDANKKSRTFEVKCPGAVPDNTNLSPIDRLEEDWVCNLVEEYIDWLRQVRRENDKLIELWLRFVGEQIGVHKLIEILRRVRERYEKGHLKNPRAYLDAACRNARDPSIGDVLGDVFRSKNDNLKKPADQSAAEPIEQFCELEHLRNLPIVECSEELRRSLVSQNRLERRNTFC